MHAADCDFSLKCIKELIKLGSDVNHQDKTGMTALDNAYTLGNTEIFAHLISAGAKCDLKNASGQTLRQQIMEDKKESFVNMLPMTAKNAKKQQKKAAKL